LTEARTHPGKLNYGTGSALWRLVTEQLLDASGAQMTHVPYAGGGAALLGLLTGQVDLVFAGEAQALQQKGKVRALAVSGATRSRSLPLVPTFAESGFPQIPSLS
jgi:tripartite-type tricarboxylate transporter receptor subunit TctC